MDKQFSDALATLNRISESARDAATWNDIAVVRSANGDLAGARDAAEKALKLQPNMPEALFNRAVILRQLDSPDASAALQSYLAVDSSSRWAEEARKKGPQ